MSKKINKQICLAEKFNAFIKFSLSFSSISPSRSDAKSDFFVSNKIDKQFCFHKSESVTLQLFESWMRTLICKMKTFPTANWKPTAGMKHFFFFFFFLGTTLRSRRKVTLSRFVTEVFIVKYHVISSAPKFENNEEKLMRIEIDRGSLLLTYLSLFSSAVDV